MSLLPAPVQSWPGWRVSGPMTHCTDGRRRDVIRFRRAPAFDRKQVFARKLQRAASQRSGPMVAGIGIEGREALTGASHCE